MREAELYDQLTVVFRDVFSSKNLTLEPELTAKDIQGWDSFKQVEIIIAVETKYAIKFRTRELDRLRSVGDLAQLILAKIADR